MSEQGKKARLEQEIAVLQEDRAGVTGSIHRMETELAILNSQVRGNRMNKDAYRELCDKQADLKLGITDLREQAMGMKNEIRRKSAEKNIPVELPPTGGSPIIPALVALRDHYEAFGSDATRVASMRRMASEFCMELSRIIKRS